MNMMDCPHNFSHDSGIEIKSPEVKQLLEKIPELNSCYEVYSKIGEGSFSKVYKASKRHLTGVAAKNDNLFALKCITSSTDPKRIAAELKYLMKAGGRKHVLGLTNCEIVRGNVILVMPYFPHCNFYEYVETLPFDKITNYMTALLTALEWIHEQGIIHRDVKPSNFLYNRSTEKYALVDFGLAQSLQNANCNSSKAIIPSNCKESSKNVPNVLNSTKNNPKLDQNNEKSRSCKRNLDLALESAKEEILPKAKKLCFDVEEENPKTKMTINSVLQPLATSNTINSIFRMNGINVTVHPPGSDIFKKPRTVLYKSVLFKENNLNEERSTIPEDKSQKPTLNESIAQSRLQLKLPLSVPTSVSIPKKSSSKYPSCQCFGKKTVCASCLAKPQEYAARAGTPGFRPPEVLLKYPNQGTAIDMWAAGVIFISLLSRRYPFFTNSEDMTALVEIACVLGINRVKKAALRMGKLITIQTEYQAKDLHTLCQSLRDHLNTSNTTRAKKETIPSAAINLLYRLLDPDPVNRITASEALKHPFISKIGLKSPRMKL